MFWAVTCEFGAWLSPVERCVRDAEVPGSNPGAPIKNSIWCSGLEPEVQPRRQEGSRRSGSEPPRRARIATGDRSSNPGAPIKNSIWCSGFEPEVQPRRQEGLEDRGLNRRDERGSPQATAAQIRAPRLRIRYGAPDWNRRFGRGAKKGLEDRGLNRRDERGSPQATAAQIRAPRLIATFGAVA